MEKNSQKIERFVKWSFLIDYKAISKQTSAPLYHDFAKTLMLFYKLN